MHPFVINVWCKYVYLFDYYLQEARSMARCLKAGIKTPIIRYVDVNRYCIIMDYIDGCTVRDFINKQLYKNSI